MNQQWSNYRQNAAIVDLNSYGATGYDVTYVENVTMADVATILTELQTEIMITVTQAGSRDILQVLNGIDVKQKEVEFSETIDDTGLAVFRYWLNGIFTNILVCVGLLANILTLSVLCQRQMISSTNSYLSALAMWDCVVLISTALLIGLPAVIPAYREQVLAYVISYLYPLALVAQTATIWLTVSFTVERYIAVSHPLKAASMCTVSRARIVVMAVSLASSAYNLPRWFEYRPQVETDHTVDGGNSGTGATRVTVNSTWLEGDPWYRLIYYSWLYLPMMCIVPLAILFALNLYLILAVRKSRRSQSEMNVKQSRENNVTIMLSAVVVVFIVCQVPALVYNVVHAVCSVQTVRSSVHYSRLSEIRNFLVNINSACNFLLYCAFGQKFRRVFLNTFCPRQCVQQQQHTLRGIADTKTGSIRLTPVSDSTTRSNRRMGRVSGTSIVYDWRKADEGGGVRITMEELSGRGSSEEECSKKKIDGLDFKLSVKSSTGGLAPGSPFSYGAARTTSAAGICRPEFSSEAVKLLYNPNETR